MTGTRGVETMVRVLERLAESRELTVRELAESEELPRSSLFDIVRRLDEAGLVIRQAGGRLTSGPAAVRLGFASFGLAVLHGPAEALLRLLRDETGGTAMLSAGNVELLRIETRRPEAQTTPTFAATVAGRVELALTLRPGATRVERTGAEIVFQQVIVSLEQLLAESEA